MIYIGVDVGVTGAVAAIDSRGSATIDDLPVLGEVAGSKRLDGRAFIRHLRTIAPGEPGSAVVMLEDIRVRSAMSGRVTSHAVESTLVGMRYAIQCCCDIAGIASLVVTPQSWKNHFGIKKDKDGSIALERARAIFPLMSAMLARKKDHNRAEALLIAQYAKDRPE